MSTDRTMTTAPDVSVLVCKLRGVVDQVRNHLSSLGLARGWILHRHERDHTTEWEARVADLEAERKAAIGAVADSLLLAGQADDGRLVDVLIRLRDGLDRYEYPGLLTWDLLANARLGVDDVDAALTELDRLASGLVVMQPVAAERPTTSPYWSKAMPKKRLAELLDLTVNILDALHGEYIERTGTKTCRIDLTHLDGAEREAIENAPPKPPGKPRGRTVKKVASK